MFFTGPVLAQFGQTQNVLTESGPAQDLIEKATQITKSQFEQLYSLIKSIVQ